MGACPRPTHRPCGSSLPTSWWMDQLQTPTWPGIGVTSGTCCHRSGSWETGDRWRSASQVDCLGACPGEGIRWGLWKVIGSKGQSPCGGGGGRGAQERTPFLPQARGPLPWAPHLRSPHSDLLRGHPPRAGFYLGLSHTSQAKGPSMPLRAARTPGKPSQACPAPPPPSPARGAVSSQCVAGRWWTSICFNAQPPGERDRLHCADTFGKTQALGASPGGSPIFSPCTAPPAWSASAHAEPRGEKARPCGHFSLRLPAEGGRHPSRFLSKFIDWPRPWSP